MSKIKLTGSNSGYVEISSAADAGNLTLALPTSGTVLLSNTDNVFTGITTFAGLNITGDVTLNGASYNVLWDASDNQLEFGDNAKLSFGGTSLQIYHGSNVSHIAENGTGPLRLSTDEFQVMNSAQDKTMIYAAQNLAVSLNYNGNTKIQTTNTGAVVTGICTATSFSGDGSALSNTSHRRLNYNGAMMINQRGNATGVTLGGYRSIDRYYTQMENSNAGTWDIGQSTDVPDGYGFKYSLDYSCTATSSNANRYLMTLYRMEGYDSQVFNYGTANAKTVTLSFWIKCSKAGNFQVNFENEQNPDAGYQTQQTINNAGQWEKKVVTIPGDTTKAFAWTSNKAMCFDIMYSAFGNYASGTPTAAWSTLTNTQRGGHCNMDLFDSTSNYVRITGVQLEIGSTATEFEHIPFNDELARCQRYFYRISAAASGTGSHKHMGTMQYYAGANPYGKMLDLPVPMRTIPTGSFTGDIRAWTSGGSNNGSFTTINFDRNDNIFLASNGSTVNQNSGAAGNATPITLYPNSTMSADAEL